MKEIKHIAFFVIPIFLITILNNYKSMASTNIKGIETPEYRLIKKIENIEIREYPDLITASTIMGSSYSANSGNGFRKVAGYIFGGNERNERISMTSPVMVEMSDTMKMSFIMPYGYEIDELPRPDNQDVIIESQGKRTLAVIRYSGYNSDNKMKKYSQLLNDILKKNKIASKGEFMFFGYNPPYRVFNRTNEIAIEVDISKK